MNIGFFTDTYFPQINGVSYTIQLWKRELEKQGHDVFVYYPKCEGYSPKKNEVPMASIPIMFYRGYRLGLPDKKMPDNLDIAHLHSPFSMAAYGLGVAKDRKIPVVLTYHTPVDMYAQNVSSREYVQESLRIFYELWERKLFKRCNLVTAPSNAIKEKLSGLRGDVIVFSNGIDTNFFKEQSPKEFLEDYEIPEGRVIGYAGRHSYEKHVEDLINIADKFDGTILISGDGPVREEFEEMAKGKKNVKFLGFLPRERMCEFYSALDILILPSTAETQGLVVLEANACGTPVVGADALALKETIENGVNGYRYKPGDSNDLLSKIWRIYRDMERLKGSSKEYARKHSVENTVKTLIELYNDLRK
ncbi:MAG: glycosyltransferase [Candidatus Altiarchaeota archaeon]|nr:glycosyltransferase [Candidatus Altiarchaeota archaeon]